MFDLKTTKHSEIISTHEYRGNNCVRCGWTSKEFVTYHKPLILPIKIIPFFAWYDFWMGLFYDKPKRKIYILILPMFGFIIEY